MLTDQLSPTAQGPDGTDSGLQVIPRTGAVFEAQNGAEMKTPGSSDGVFKVWVNGQVAATRRVIM